MQLGWGSGPGWLLRRLLQGGPTLGSRGPSVGSVPWAGMLLPIFENSRLEARIGEGEDEPREHQIHGLVDT